MLEHATLARPYARAAFAQATAEGMLVKWSQVLSRLAVVVNDRQMRQLLHDPRLDNEQMQDVLLAVLGEDIGQSMRNFLRILLQTGRIRVAPAINKLFSDYYAEAEGIARVQVRSAYPLLPELQQKLREALARRYGKRVEMELETDQELIGGIVVRHGDSVIDASVRGQIQQLRNRFAA